MPFLISLMFPGDGMQHHGEDEAGRQLIVYFVFGGGLFFTLWAWIGNVSAVDWRKGGRMIVGILLAAAVVMTPRLFFPSGFGLDGWRGDVIFLAIWAGTSAVFAYLAGKRGTIERSPR